MVLYEVKSETPWGEQGQTQKCGTLMRWDQQGNLCRDQDKPQIWAQDAV